MQRNLFVGIFIVCMLAATASAFIDEKELEKKLAEKRHQFVHMFNSGDDVGLAHLFTKDATLLPFRHPRVTGTFGIINYLQSLHKSGIVGLIMEPHAILPLTQGDCTVDPASLSYSYVAERGTFRFYQTGAIYKLRGEYMMTWRVYSSGDARIHWDIFNEVFEADED